MSRRIDMHGFTLVELMITLALVVIVATIAVPNFTTLIRNNQLQGKAEELKAFLNYARSQAVLNRVSYTVQIDDEDPWEIKSNRTDAEVERTLEHNPQQVELLSTDLTDDKLIYSSNGTATAARITLCHDDDPTTGYLLEVQASGRAVVYARGKKDAAGTDLTTCTP